MRKAAGVPEENSVSERLARHRLLASQRNQKKPSRFAETVEDIRQMGSNIKSRFVAGADKVGEIRQAQSRGEQGGFQSAFQTFGAGAGAASQSYGDIFTGVIKGALSQEQEDALKGKVEETASKVMENPLISSSIKSSMEAFKGLDENTQRNLEALFNIGMLALDVATLGGGKKVLEKGVETGIDVAQKGAKVAGEVIDTGIDGVKEIKNKVTKAIASEPSEQVKTILRETPTSKLDEYVEIARKHSLDNRELSGFEKASEMMTDAATQIKKQLSSLGEQKSTILQKAKIGLEEFKDSPRRAILEVMKLEDSPIKEQVIAKLKNVKTKLDADKAIDEIQDMIYSGTRQMTIAQGSKLEKQLRGIIGKMNSELKDTLPDAYKSLNDSFSATINNLNSLNRGLGEVVGDVSASGAGLIKRFFSPSGSKTKELFEFIKKKTGIDLAQEATVAKFAEELFDNPNVKSLLGGIPRSKTGVIDSMVDFVVDKTGVGGKARDALREGLIERAKDLTK